RDVMQRSPAHGWRGRHRHGYGYSQNSGQENSSQLLQGLLQKTFLPDSDSRCEGFVSQAAGPGQPTFARIVLTRQTASARTVELLSLVALCWPKDRPHIRRHLAPECLDALHLKEAPLSG